MKVKNKCLGKSNIGFDCFYKCVNKTQFCKNHQYMCDYSQDMLNNMQLCKGCKKYYYLENGLSTCQSCRDRGKDVRKEIREKVILCKHKGCIFKKSEENDYCGKHQLSYWKDTTEKDKTKKICSNYVRGCRNTLHVDSIFSRCDGCRNKTSHIVIDYKSSANKRGLEYKLSDKDVALITMDSCKYCYQIDEFFEFLSSRKKYKTGIDRFDNQKDYTFDNCVACCRYCNIIKSNKTYENFIINCKNISTNFSGKMTLSKFKYDQQKLELLYKNHNHCAKVRNLITDITKIQFINFMNYNCYYCNSKNSHTSNLDRIDSNKNYVIDNVVPCCGICNKMKFDIPFEIFIKKIKAIVYLSNKDKTLTKRFNYAENNHILEKIINDYKYDKIYILENINDIVIGNNSIYQYCIICKKFIHFKNFNYKDKTCNMCITTKNINIQKNNFYKFSTNESKKCILINTNNMQCCYIKSNNSNFCYRHKYINDFTSFDKEYLMMCKGCSKIFPFKGNKLCLNCAKRTFIKNSNDKIKRNDTHTKCSDCCKFKKNEHFIGNDVTPVFKTCDYCRSRRLNSVARKEWREQNKDKILISYKKYKMKLKKKLEGE